MSNARVWWRMWGLASATIGVGCYSGLGATGGDPTGAGDSGNGGDGSATEPGNSDDSGGSDGAGDGDDGAVPEAGADSQFPRLSHKQWENTVRDLFGLAEITGLSSAFVGDPVAGGFDNNGASLDVGAVMWADYQIASEALAELVVTDAEVLARISPPDVGQDFSERAGEFVASFGRRAYRRPLTAAETDELEVVFLGAADVYSDLDPWTAGVHLTVQTLLQSPYFLYRVVDGEPDDLGRIQLDGYEVATRLSYALWNTMPDDELFSAADAGDLDAPEGIRAQAARLLGHPHARATVEDLHNQLLQLDAYLDRSKDPDFFPQFNVGLGPKMQTEARRFIEDVVFDQGQGYAELLTATHTFVDSELAAIYGLDVEVGAEFQRVELDATERSGLLTRSGFLMSKAYQVDPDPIHRGAFIAFDLLCNDRPPIPDNVTAVEPDPTKTNRERVDDHTGPGTCGGGCHSNLINPLGFAFEHYDAIGGFRTEDNGKPVNAADKFRLDGEDVEYANAIELSNLLADSKQAHDCYAQQLFEYTYGRDSHEADLAVVDELGTRSQEGTLPITGILTELVTREEFRFIRLPEES